MEEGGVTIRAAHIDVEGDRKCWVLTLKKGVLRADGP